MDLHIIGAEPTEDERWAVDALLGPPDSGWVGGPRDAARDTRVAYGGLEAIRDRRDLLLPALHAVQDRVGWVSRGALNYICKRLVVPPAEAWGVVTFYHLFNTEPAPRQIIHLCDDIACRLHDLEVLADQLDQSGVAWQRSPCLGQCERAPAALLVRAGDVPSAEAVTRITSGDELATRLKAGSGGGDSGDGPAAPVSGDAVGLDAAASREASTVGSAIKLLRRVGKVEPLSLDSYKQHGGYGALARACELGPDGVIQEVIASNLLGRGGAAFPTGRKWEAVARERTTPHFLVCNADESEPGTFKDRVLLESDPFAIVEAMTIAGFATGCAQAFIYVRDEYPLARQRVQHAIDVARGAGLLGANVMERGIPFDIELRRGAGAYICGEETALFNSLEGRRGEPRSKPPFPAQVGLFGKPTVVNNVETLFNVLDIVVEGGATWAQVGTKASTGTRLFCLSGDVVRPGLYEAAFGTTLQELLTRAGGVAHGRSLQAVLLGGAAGTFVGPEALSLRLTFEDVRAAGATLGSGVVMVFDDTVDLRDTLVRIAEFMRDESCGQCVPCRVGTVRQVEILERMRRHPASPVDLEVLTELGQAMRDASICGLGQTASSAVETAIARLDVFRNGGAA